MNFLALGPLQIAALLAGTGAAIFGLYLLKPPPRRVVVPSNLIWERLLRERKKSSLLDRLRWWISLLVALAIGLGVAAGIGRPELASASGDRRRIAVVVDNSPTMRARAPDGTTRFEHALRHARGLLGQGRAGSEFMVADTAGQISAARFQDRRRALEVLDSLEPAPAGQVRFPRLPVDDAELYLITDGVLVDVVPDEAEVVSVFQPVDNVGITAFEVRPVPADPAGFQAYLEVVNGSAAAKEVTLRVSGVSTERLESTVSLGAGESLAETIDLVGFGRGAVRAAVSSAGDALSADDVAYSWLPARRGRRVVLVTRGNLYLEMVIALDPRVTLRALSPREYVEQTPAADVYVFDRYAPPEPPPGPAIMVRPPETPWLMPISGRVATPPVAGTESGHPLLEFVSLDDLSIEEADRISMPDGTGVGLGPGSAQIVLGTPALPLIVATETPIRRIRTTFDLERSNFPLQPGFPIFLSNAMTWMMDEQLALARAPGRVEVPVAGGSVTGLDGDELPAWELLDQTVFDAPEPGLYTVSRGARRLHVAVNTTDRRLTEVNRSGLAPEESGSALGAAAAGVAESRVDELWMVLLTAAVLLVIAEWWTYHRRLTV